MKGLDEHIEDWRPAIKVMCGKCKDWIPEDETEFLDIEEDIQGADVLTFKCPHCKTTQKSRRYG